MLTALASNISDEQEAVPTCNASNSQPVQPGVEVPAVHDDPLGCALFQGTPGGDSEKTTTLTRYVNP